MANVHIAALQEERASLQAEALALRRQSQVSTLQTRPEPAPFKISIARGDRSWEIDPALFETFAFRSGDELTVLPVHKAVELPKTWGDIHVPVGPGRAIRVPPRYELFEFRDFKIPAHLISLTGAGPETLDVIGKRHVEL